MTRLETPRLVGWLAVVAALATANYVVRYAVASTSGGISPLYRYSTAAGAVVQYALFFFFAYLISAGETRRLFALRRPRSWPAALGLALLVIVLILVLEGALSRLPIESPAKEQGLAPQHWQPHYAGPFAANAVVVVLLAPFVEEIFFRGVGYGLLARFGRPFAILAVGLTFGAVHGVVIGLLVLVPFGAGLAWLRSRVDSVVPGMLVHGTFNALALLVVLSR